MINTLDGYPCCMNALTITAPDDWHLHLRDGDALKTTVNHAACTFKRAIIMPNLAEPVTTVNLAQRYYTRIIEALPKGTNFKPLMTLYLNQSLTPDEIKQATLHDNIKAVKWYPKGATTNSNQGVPNIALYYDTLKAMAECGLPLLIHGEVINPQVDIFDRESTFIEQELKPLIENFPNLKIVLEHISTLDAVDFILDAPNNVGATITAHHLWLNRNDLLVGGIKPHHYCLPIVKTMDDQKALIMAATSGNPKFFLGTDSAPHEKFKKQSACGCAGIYTAPIAMPLYTQIFESQNALSKLEGFASHFGADFYGVPRNKQSMSLIKKPWQVPRAYPFDKGEVVPFMAGKQLNWQIEGVIDG